MIQWTPVILGSVHCIAVAYYVFTRAPVPGEIDLDKDTKKKREDLIYRLKRTKR